MLRSRRIMTRVARWEQRTEWPLAAGAAVFLAAYAWPILDTDMPPGWRHACTTITVIVWAAFAADYVVRLAIAEQRWTYFWHHLVDLGVVALPILRPLRLLRLVMLLGVLNRRAATSLYGRIATYVAGAVVLLVFCASLAILDAERADKHANITNFADALWWSATTMTTVGYGDRYPVTGEGRLVAVGLMIGGIALLGVVTASIASWLINRVREVEQASQAITRHDLDQLATKIDQLHTLLTTNTTTDNGATSTPRPQPASHLEPPADIHRHDQKTRTKT